MARNLETDVLIIGCGPTGMVAALCLNQLGVNTVVIERQGGPREHPKAHELSGRSIEILHGLGFGYEELAAEASPHEDASRILFCDTIAEEFGCIDLNTGPSAGAYAAALPSPWPFLNISQVELEKVILRRVEAAERVTLCWRHQWEAMEENGNRVISRVLDRDSGEELRISSRYVLCADGAGSRSRKALGIEMIGPAKIRDVVNAYLEADFSQVVSTRGKLYFIFNPGVTGSVFIAHHIERRWVFNTPIIEGKSLEDYTPEVMTDLARKALGRADIPFEIKTMSHWRMSAQVAERFRQGRAFLVGDAAHRFPPTGGLGMNSGIGDAQNISWKLAAVLRGRAPESLLDTYEMERRPVIQVNCDESHRNFSGLLEVIEAFGIDVESTEKMLEKLNTGPIASLPAPGQAWIRRQVNRYGARVLSRYHKDPEIRERVIGAIALQRPHFDRIGLELGYAYAEGALLDDATPPVVPEYPVTQYIPNTRPGARFPHFWLDGNPKQRSSYELLDPRVSTLILGAHLDVPAEEREGIDQICERLGVQVRSLASAPICPAYVGAVHTRCQIDYDGALMVRPDDHVAWRQRSGVRLSAALLRSIVDACYGTRGERREGAD